MTELDISTGVLPMEFESAFETRAKLFNAVERGVVDQSVICILLRDGAGVRDEAALWDFKLHLPIRGRLGKEDYDFKMHEIVKDATAFYNSFGGYIVAGVQDKSRSVLGFDDDFDVEVSLHGVGIGQFVD